MRRWLAFRARGWKRTPALLAKLTKCSVVDCPAGSPGSGALKNSVPDIREASPSGRAVVPVLVISVASALAWHVSKGEGSASGATCVTAAGGSRSTTTKNPMMASAAKPMWLNFMS